MVTIPNQAISITDIFDSNILDYMAEVEKEQENLKKSKMICSQRFSADWVDKVLGENDEGCSKERFTLAVLVQMQVCFQLIMIVGYNCNHKNFPLRH